jgi:filamentous hemagglutinin family protein
MEILMMENMKTRLPFSVLLFLTFGVVHLNGLPEGTTAVSGGGSASVMGSEMTIQAPDGSIFEHQSFHVSPVETVRFVQPSATARTLNRITGPTPSQIDGRMIANGEVYLVNPSGIIFGEGSVMEANKLHAVAGSLSNANFLSGNDQYSTLSGTVENAGAIRANEVVLGGKTVRNRGSIISRSGVVAMAAGTGLQLARMDGSLTVSLTSVDPAQIGSASDLAGQALLDSGIIEATKVFLRGNQVSQHADGTLRATELDADGGAANLGTTVQVNSKANRVSNLKLNGSFTTLMVRSSVSMNVESSVKTEEPTVPVNSYFPTAGPDPYSNLGPAPPSGYIPNSGPNQNAFGAKRRSSHEDELVTIGAQKVDLRVDGNDLTVQVGFSPIFSGSPSSLLLAADGNLNVMQNIGELGQDEILLFGENLSASSFQSLDPKPVGMDVLKASSLTMDDLSHDLSASSMMALFAENPSFAVFGSEDLASFSSGSEETEVNGQNPVTVPESPSFSGPATATPVLGSTGPGYSPSTLSPPYAMNSGGTLSLEQLRVASQYGAFAGRSYFLQARPRRTEEEIMLAEFARSGGVSSSFGGSYAVVASADGGSAVDSSADSGDGGESESSAEEGSSEEEGGEGMSQDQGAAMNAARARALGAIPFAPISRPILSPDASAVLEQALSPQIERNLQKYLYR